MGPPPSRMSGVARLPYRHTQRGTVLLVAFLASAALGSVPVLLAGKVTLAAAVAALLTLLALLFGSLTVEVDARHLRLRFGPGLVRASWEVARIEEVVAVRTRWWHGWGIHLGFHGWLYNVSGFDAVELRLRGGKRVRIGTDRPDEFCAALREAAGLP